MSAQQTVLENLAAAFLAGEWSAAQLARRGAEAWGRREPWLPRLVARLLKHFGSETPRPDRLGLERFLEADPGFQKAWGNCRAHQELPPRRVFWVSDTMSPTPGRPASWTLPELSTPGAVAEWLGITPKELDRFADCRGFERSAPAGPVRHYSYRWLAKPNGRARLLEVPKARLRAIQRRLLHDLLDLIPPHEAAHGYRRGRSIATCVAPHSGRAVVLRLDLRDFFTSVSASRVHALFRTAGFPIPVARLLTGLCTNSVPDEVLLDWPNGRGAPNWQARQRFRFAHLPQGAPTSPALANLCAYRLDCRLAGLAAASGASYTRYADDLVFSGDAELEQCVRRFHVGVCSIALEEGFEAHTRKSRFMRQAVRQQVAGIVLNVHPNVARREYDRLRVILTNCTRHGPHAQNRSGHLDFRGYLMGRIAYVGMLNPSRGQKLRTLFDQIRWHANPVA
jgi:hypothetical protein